MTWKTRNFLHGSPNSQEFGLRIGSPMFKARSPFTHLITSRQPTTARSRLRFQSEALEVLQKNTERQSKTSLFGTGNAIAIHDLCCPFEDKRLLRPQGLLFPLEIPPNRVCRRLGPNRN